jgi:hypothetical protein
LRFPTLGAKTKARQGWGTQFCCNTKEPDQEAATGIPAQHSMKDGVGGEWIESGRQQRDLIDHLEGVFASDTVNAEVDADFNCCFRLYIAI